VKLKIKRRAKDPFSAAADPAGVVKLDQDPFAFVQIAGTGDVLQSGGAAGPGVEPFQGALDVSPAVGTETDEVRLPGRGQRDVRSAGGYSLLRGQTGGPESGNEKVRPGRIGRHHRQHNLIPGPEGAGGDSLRQPGGTALLGTLLGEHTQVVGIDAVFRRLAGGEEFQPALGQDAPIPVPAPQQRCQANQPSPLLEKTQPQLPASQAAVDAPPGQQPVG